MRASSSGRTQACLPPEDPDAAAVAWIVRLHSGRASAADRRDFAAWRRHSPGNERAALAAERLWEQLGDAGRPLLAQVQARPWRPTRRRLLQAGLATAAAGGLALLPRYPLATFTTATGERARVTVDAGVTAELDARTGLNVARENAHAQVEVLGGRALLATSGDRPLAVRAPGHEAVLRGATELEVDLRQGDPRLAVLAGGLELRPHDLPSSTLAAPAGVVLAAGGGARPLTGLELAAAGAWRRGQLVYHDQPLRAVLADLERYRGGRVVALDDRLAAARVTGVFALGDPDAALDAIGAALGVAVTRWPLLAVVRPA